jgi:hypothetical protein
MFCHVTIPVDPNRLIVGSGNAKHDNMRLGKGRLL